VGCEGSNTIRNKKSTRGGRQLPNSQNELLEAADRCLQQYGVVGLSTRRVADAARMPLSQIHYYFGSKEALILALLAYKNERLLTRQREMYSQRLPLWKRWQQACDYLEEDLASGYVRVLQEMIAAGWSNPAIAEAVRKLLSGWFALLNQVAGEAAEQFADTGPMKQDEVAALVAAAFLGAEALLLLGVEETQIPLRRALQRFGVLIRNAEKDS
jgi:AcrR family transcriptional regulator